MAQLNIGLGLGFSSISIPDLEKDESEIHANKIEISWFGKNCPFIQCFLKLIAFSSSNSYKSYHTNNIIFQLLFYVSVKW